MYHALFSDEKRTEMMAQEKINSMISILIKASRKNNVNIIIYSGCFQSVNNADSGNFY